jgi:protein SCO1/2
MPHPSVSAGLLVASLALAAPAPGRAATKRTVEAKEPTAAAAYQPNMELVTQQNRTVRFYDDLVKGKVVLINFMFTTCTSICPPMTANLAQVQRLLKEYLGDRVVMISITVDPEHDTPAVLAAYAERYSAGPGWYFLTGPKDRIDAVVSKLGDNSHDKLKHSGMLLIGNDPARTWKKGFAMAAPEEIAAAVRRMLAEQPKGAGG